EASFVGSTTGYVDVQDELSGDEKLRRLTQSMYPELAAADGGDAGQACAELHTILRMLQVMENAWLSLNLDVHHAPPLNRGWMDVFNRWTSSETFRRVWPLARSEFARRFVSFCERQMRVGQVEVTLRPLTPDKEIPAVLRREFADQWPPAQYRSLE